VGYADPYGVQRLLNSAHWDADAVRDALRTYVVEALEAEDGVLIVDETGFLKKGTRSVGVARQYTGTAGKRENSQVGVFLTYASSRGHALVDRALYLPEGWATDRDRRRDAGVPDGVTFATKPALAITMLEHAFAAGVVVGWVTADSIYGDDHQVRRALEEREQPYVVGISGDHRLWQDGEHRRVDAIMAALPPEAWRVLSAGEGTKGERLYAWACLALPIAASGGTAHWVLARRGLADGTVSFFRVYGPATTTVETMAGVSGMRWRIEESIQTAKGEVGLDQYEVRTWIAWHRFITLAMVAHAVLQVVRSRLAASEADTPAGAASGAQKGGPTWAR
jgi:SRSO17 transposase